MKNKLVIWGSNAENEKFLIALELQAESNRVMLHIFPEAIADEAFVQKMMHEWRDGKAEVAFPEGTETSERELSVTESLLPEGIVVERPDLVQRAQTEWHFAVLSSKLHAAYQQELAEFKEKVEAMSTYDNKIFTSLRSFWDKVQNQSRERNLYRQHADELRDGINALFEQLKEVRKKVNSEFMEVSQGVFDGFAKALDDIETRIAAGGAKFNSVFDELKKMQRDYHQTRMSNEHRNKLWERLDAAFKRAKERKFGPEANAGTIADRHDKRLSGLEDAIKRLEDSLYRDDEELAFQRKKVHTSEGQLEAQIRGAKIKMIEERANGKRERLAELTKARNDVHRQANSAHEKEARLAAKEAERQLIEAKKAAIKSEIEAETHAKAEAAASPAVALAKEGAVPEKEESLFEAASNLLGDVLLDALDTAKAVAIVAADKAEEAFGQAMDKAEEMLESFNAPASAEATADETAGKKEAPVAEAAPDLRDAEALESFTQEEAPAATETGDGIIIDDVVHKSAGDAEALESFKPVDEPISAEASTSVETSADETAGKDGIIIDDVVHKAAGEAEALESFKQEEAPAATETGDGIIIDDVVHKTAEDAEALESFKESEPATAEASAGEEDPAAKPKRVPKKKADA